MKAALLFLSLSVFVGAMLPHARSTTASQLPPNGSLKVAYRQLVEGKLSESVHQIELSCWEGQCSLTTLTLNQCAQIAWGDTEEKAFIPRVERTSTYEGNLSVIVMGKGLLAVEEVQPDITFKYRFTYEEKPTPKRMAEVLQSRVPSLFDRVTGFSGGVVKQSAVFQKVLSWELVPLKWANRLPPTVEVTCKVMLDGIQE